MNQVGGDVHQRDEDEGAFVQARVRDDERRRVEDEVIVEQDVEIDETRPPTEGVLASDLDLGLFQRSEEGVWLERRPCMDDHVEERGLVGVAPGRSLVDSRNSDPLKAGRKKREGGAEVVDPIAEVGPEGKVGVVGHVIANIPETRFLRNSGLYSAQPIKEAE